MIRPERPGDEQAVYAVTEAAFGQKDEAELVNALRDAGALTISLLAWLGDRPVGHIAFSPVTVSGSVNWQAIALGPVSIVPDQQNEGIGSRLVRLGLAHCLAADQDVVFLLGHTTYYPRFGFRPAPPLGLICKWSQGDPFMVAELREGALAGRTGMVNFHKAFG